VGEWHAQPGRKIIIHRLPVAFVIPDSLALRADGQHIELETDNANKAFYFYEGGTLDIKFTNIVWPDERVTAKGVITDERDGKANVTVWMEKDDGTVVIVGSASAAV